MPLPERQLKFRDIVRSIPNILPSVLRFDNSYYKGYEDATRNNRVALQAAAMARTGAGVLSEQVTTPLSYVRFGLGKAAGGALTFPGTIMAKKAYDYFWDSGKPPSRDEVIESTENKHSMQIESVAVHSAGGPVDFGGYGGGGGYGAPDEETAPSYLPLILGLIVLGSLRR